jgi:hypothetical protein
MPDSIGDLIALFLGMAVLWLLVGSGDQRRSPRKVKGGS